MTGHHSCLLTEWTSLSTAADKLCQGGLWSGEARAAPLQNSLLEWECQEGSHSQKNQWWVLLCQLQGEGGQPGQAEVPHTAKAARGSSFHSVRTNQLFLYVS